MLHFLRSVGHTLEITVLNLGHREWAAIVITLVTVGYLLLRKGHA